MESEESDLGSSYKTQVTSSGNSTGHRAYPINNHNPKWRFTSGGNCLSQLFINRAVTCTYDQWPVTCFQPAMVILRKFSRPCGCLLRSIVTVSFSKNSNGIFQYFFSREGNSKARHSIYSCKKCQRNRPDYYYLDVLKFMPSTKTKEITLSVRGEQYNSFAFPRGLEASMNFNTSAILTWFRVD